MQFATIQNGNRDCSPCSNLININVVGFAPRRVKQRAYADLALGSIIYNTACRQQTNCSYFIDVVLVATGIQTHLYNGLTIRCQKELHFVILFFYYSVLSANSLQHFKYRPYGTYRPIVLMWADTQWSRTKQQLLRNKHIISFSQRQFGATNLRNKPGFDSTPTVLLLVFQLVFRKQ